MSVRDEAQARALFQERYRNTPSPLACQIEQRRALPGPVRGGFRTATGRGAEENH